MSLRRSTPLTFHPKGISDAQDSSLAFSGSMSLLTDLIPDPSTRGLWECRPASMLLGDMMGTSGSFSSGFSSGFSVAVTSGIFPTPQGVVSALLIVGDMAYGMFAAGAVNQDYPFAFNLTSNSFVAVSGVVTGAGTNLPTTQVSTGDWTPPTMDVIGSTIMVTHPGFAGTGNWLGWFDITNPATPVWHAGNLTYSATPFFSATTGVPVAVKTFFGRAYWAYNPGSGPSATVFSDPLTPFTATNSAVPQIITYDDNVPITALGALPLSNQLGGIIQALLVFKGVTNIFQITGDISINSTGVGSFGTLAKNALNVATGTFAPNSISSTPKGIAFVAPDGVRIIDFNAQVSDPIGNDGQGKTLPFLLATAPIAPSRIAAAANGTVYRVSVQDASLINSPQVEYWLDISRAGVWSGPHSFPARMIKAYKNTFVIAPWAADHALFKSDYLQTLASSFVENNKAMMFNWLTSYLPDTDQMCENAMIETTIYLNMGFSASYNVQAVNEASSVLNSVQIINPSTGPTFWGTSTSTPPGFIWGQAKWGGLPSALYPQRVAWTKPVVFRRMAVQVQGAASQQFRIGTLHMKYEQLGYLQQPMGVAA